MSARPIDAELLEALWPLERLGELIDSVSARVGGRSDRAIDPEPLPPGRAEVDLLLEPWLRRAAERRGLEFGRSTTLLGDLRETLAAIAPAIVAIEKNGEPRYLAVLRSSRNSTIVIDLAGERRRLSTPQIAAALLPPATAAVGRSLDMLLDTVAAQGQRRRRAHEQLLRDVVGGLPVGGFWLIRPSPSVGLWRRLRFARLPRRVLLLSAIYTLTYILTLGAWWLLGRGALGGRLDPEWLTAWCGVTLTVIVLGTASTWLEGMTALELATVVKQMLLEGALRIRPELVRHLGLGQLLGLVIESGMLESVALAGGFLMLVAVIEWCAAFFVLSHAAGASWLVPAAALTGAGVAIGAAFSWRARARWVRARLGLTLDLTEKLLGHRTRLIQEEPARWHADEDGMLSRYNDTATRADWAVGAVIVAPRLWMLLAFAGLAPTLLSGGHSPVGMALAIGGMLLVLRALSKVGSALDSLAVATVAWSNTRVLTQRPAIEATPAPRSTMTVSPTPRSGDLAIEARGLVFRYGPDRPPALRGCDLRICVGERVLIEGPSGGGKSTLMSVLGGLRRAESGLLLHRSLDLETIRALGQAPPVVFAPQFHDNHVFSSTFAFNVLLGRAWPPSDDDMRLAREVCDELGLGPLLDRMPGGLNQIVGDTGWQLSHGEKSRMFVARTLLQKGDVVMLDESFAALDPETLQRCMEVVQRRAGTLIIAAHV